MKKMNLKLFVCLLCFSISANSIAQGSYETLYEYSFSENGIDETWTDLLGVWQMEGDCVVANSDNIEMGWIGSLYTTIHFNGIYKSLKVLVETTDYSSTNEVFYIGIGDGYFDTRKNVTGTYPEGFFTCSYPYDDPIGTCRLSLQLYKGSPKKSGVIHVKSVKVTGIRCYDINSSITTIDNFFDFYSLPDNSIVKINVNEAEVCQSNQGKSYLQDGISGIVVSNAAARNLQETIIPSRGCFSGVLYGILKNTKGVKTLVGVTTNIASVDVTKSLYELKPIEITEEQYWSGEYTGKYVAVKPTFESSGYEVTDILGYSKTNYTVMFDAVSLDYVYQGYINYYICGVAYPRVDYIMELGYLYTPRHYEYILFTEDNENDTELGGTPITGVARRNFIAGKWHSLILPFKITNSKGTLAVLESSSEDVLNFTTVESVKAGHPFLFKPNEDYDELINVERPEELIDIDFEAMMNGEGSVLLDCYLYPETRGDYKFIPLLNAGTPASGSFYLTADNKIKSITEGGTIKGLHAYFEPVNQNVPQARSICIDGITTAIGELDVDGLGTYERNIHSLSGRTVGKDLNALSKGVYIVNGKKIIK